MRLAVMMHDVTLVVDNVLNGHRRGYHLPGRAEMIELATLQWNNGYRQVTQLGVIDGGMSP